MCVHSSPRPLQDGGTCSSGPVQEMQNARELLQCSELEWTPWKPSHWMDLHWCCSRQQPLMDHLTWKPESLALHRWADRLQKYNTDPKQTEDVWLWRTTTSLGTVGGSLESGNQYFRGVWIQPGAVSYLLRTT